MRNRNLRRVTAVTGLALASALAVGGTAQAATAGAGATDQAAKGHVTTAPATAGHASADHAQQSERAERGERPERGDHQGITAKGKVTDVEKKKIRGQEVTVIQVGDSDVKWILGLRPGSPAHPAPPHGKSEQAEPAGAATTVARSDDAKRADAKTTVAKRIGGETAAPEKGDPVKLNIKEGDKVTLKGIKHPEKDIAIAHMVGVERGDR